MISMIARLKSRGLLFGAVFAGMVSLGVALTWCYSLFTELDAIVSQRTLQRPTVVFSDSVMLEKGMILSRNELAAWLQERGYMASREQAPAAGRFKWINSDRLFVHFRPFRFPDGSSIDGAYRFIFRDAVLSEIQRLPDQRPVDSLPLEPMVMATTAKDGVRYSSWIPLEGIPDDLKKAIIASEDRRFYVHAGIDVLSLLRAATINVRRRGIFQGGSTLTQQLVKNAFLTKKRTFRRKLTEALLSVAMEIRYRKDTILTMYLNQIYLGQNGSRGIYGVQDASQTYFGKHVSDLTLGECALIAGIIPAPNTANPRTMPRRALARRDAVLSLMVQANAITKAEAEKARREPLNLARSSLQSAGSYYAAHVRELVRAAFPGEDVDGKGYAVYTAMDPRLQKAADRILAGQEFEGAIIAMDPRTGDVKALSGGRDYGKSQFNRALYARRQPGSAFKPIVYAAALEARAITLASHFVDEPLIVADDDGLWEPQNYDGIFMGTVTVRAAIVHSRNIPVIRVIDEVGPHSVARLGAALGISSYLKPVPSLALGTSEVTPLQLTSAYAAFGNGGYAVTPVFVHWITDSKGKVIRQYPPVRRQVISGGTASLITDVLRDVVDHGTGFKVRESGFSAPCAGKTGTSDDSRDAWFLGYTPELLCTVWLGYDRPRSLGEISSNLSVPLWVAFMKEADRRTQPVDFTLDPEVVRVAIDADTGMLAVPGCGNRIEELFLKGTEPTERCTLHGVFINNLFKGFFKNIKTP